MRFEGTADYVATPDLTVAVNAAIVRWLATDVPSAWPA